ncbi:MAG: GTP-binding protein [Thermoplasmata archaeon]|nr:MAG: GTP-binding protein [Thermoplasmata archaeon]
MTEAKEMVKKMCVIGEGAVGKTSLIRRFVYNKYEDRYVATIGTKTTAKPMQINIDEKVVGMKLQIWDIQGLRCFSKLQMKTYKGANGAFIVIDITRKETIFSFEAWLLSLYKVAGEIPVVVLANKNDLEAELSEDEIMALLRIYGFPYFLTSAKTGDNVSIAFETLSKMMVTPWSGLKMGHLPEITGGFVKGMEVELTPGRRLSALEVEDIIMARYCDLLEDPDIAMSMIRAQFKKADVNFAFPTVEGLSKVVDLLIDAASNQIEASRLTKEKKAYTSLIRMIA